ncbi:MAG: hypothetical protein AAF639_42690 [Chloroflexota bacterium]
MFQDLPHTVAARTGLTIIVMFDEFQRLDQVVYYAQVRCWFYACNGFSGPAETLM